jgi:transcriptional regulator GlxA family with amidase domain
MTYHPQKMPIRRVVILVYDGVQILDVAGPLQALATANEEGANPRYQVIVASIRPGTVKTASGLDIRAVRLPPPASIDTLLIPGGPGIEYAQADARMLSAIRSAGQKVRRLCAVCTGAFIAAAAGVLDGRRAVTHWRACERFAHQYPQVRLERDPIFVQDGHVWSSAGVTAGIDLTLALIEEDHGGELAARVARRLVVYLRRPGGQSQYSEPLALQAKQTSAYGRVLSEVATKPALKWRIDKLASNAGQSPRTFFRRFKSETGLTPAQAVERIRLERARILLETTDVKMDVIAAGCGFGSLETMRRIFQHHFHTSPGTMRQHFKSSRGPKRISGEYRR